MNDNCEGQLSAPNDVSRWIELSAQPGFYPQSLEEMNRDLSDTLAQIAAVPAGQRTFANTVLPADAILDRYNSRGVTLKTIASLRDLPEGLKEEAHAFESGYVEGVARLSANAELYAALNEAVTLPGIETDLKLALLRGLKDGGASLAPEARQRIGELTGKAAALTAQFKSALQNDSTVVELSGSELKGTSSEFTGKYLGPNQRCSCPLPIPRLWTNFCPPLRTKLHVKKSTSPTADAIRKTLNVYWISLASMRKSPL